MRYVFLFSTLLLAGWHPLQEAASHRPVFFPSGDELLYMSNRHDGDWELFRKTIGSGSATRLTDHVGWDGYAAVAPDGRSIVLDREGSAGRGLVRLDLDSGLEEWLLGPVEFFVGGARYSPDGEQILYVSEADGNREIYRMSLQERSPVRVTHTEQNEVDPSWSPDGQLIAYGVWLSDKRSAIEIYDSHHDVVHQVLTTPGRLYGLEWARDGRSLFYNDDSDGDQEIYVTDLDGERRKLTDNDYNDHLPARSPVADEIVFTAEPDGVERVFVLALKSGELRLVDVE